MTWQDWFFQYCEGRTQRDVGDVMIITGNFGILRAPSAADSRADAIGRLHHRNFDDGGYTDLHITQFLNLLTSLSPVTTHVTWEQALNTPMGLEQPHEY